MIQLRPDQWTSVRALASAFAEGCTRVLVQGPTGWGKGSVAAYVLATRAARHGRRGLFVCHRSEINLDLAGRLQSAGAPSVRLLMGDRAEVDVDAAVTVASIQTLDARDDLDLSRYDLVWIDEAHRTAAPTYLALQPRAPHARFVGSTATPARPDGKGLDFYQRLLAGPQVSALVAAGLLAPVIVLAPDEEVEDLSRDPLEVIHAGRPTIVFAANVGHSRSIASRLAAKGIRAMHLDGRTPDDRREKAIADFNTGRIDCLVNGRLLTEGVDLPDCAAVVLASRMDSIVAYLQSIGRGRRPREGKTCRVYDLHGIMHRDDFGHPDQDRTFSLTGKAIRLTEALDPVRNCPSCLAWFYTARCPQCGSEGRLKPPKEPRVTARELHEQHLQQKRAALPREGEQWEFFARCVRVQRERGYKPRYAAAQFHLRFGRWPAYVPEMVEEERAA